MPTQNTTKRQPQTSERLTETALRMFSTKGYSATSLRDLAQNLGVQAGSLYHHIESKQALLFEIIEEALECLFTEIRRALKGHPGPDQRLRRFVLAYVRVQTSHARSMLLLEREVGHLSTAQLGRVDQLRQACGDCLQGILRCLMQNRTTGPRHLQMITSAVLGIIHSTLPLLRQSPTLEDRVEQLLTIIYKAVQITAPTPE